MSTSFDNALGVAGVAAALPGLVQVCQETQLMNSERYVFIARECSTNKNREPMPFKTKCWLEFPEHE